MIVKNLFRKTVIGGGPVGITPSSLAGMELYLDSKLGISVADGAPFGPTAPNLWNDQSGNGRHAGTQGLLGPKPVYHSTGANRTANGSPVVSWSGGQDALGNSNPNPLPSITNGWTIFAYGRFAPNVLCSILFQDTLGGSPQLGYQDATLQSYFKRDATGIQTGSSFGGVTVYGSMAFTFQPPALTNPALCIVNGVQKYSLSWNWVPGASSGYLIGTNQIGNCAVTCDLAALVWYSRFYSSGIIAALDAYFRHRFG